MSETRILIVDDHPLFRRGVRQLVEMDPGMTIAGEASNGVESVEAAGQLDLDLILMDLNMANMDGLEALRQMRSNGVDTRIVMLTVSDADDDVVAALRAGADGYLLKDMEPEDLLARIKEAAEGKLVISPQLAAILAGIVSGGRAAPADALSSLTSRELDILRALARGMSNKMIARRLDITEGTVKVHVKNLLKKLGLRSRVEAAVWAVNQGVS
ncbi:two-component system response regulator NarL [Chromohalobacter sp. TMW 2.2308]|uniref:Two-component system response regulator NarL n=1 Tax=Chromohalobacter moromii TaxID=2860329 RepID=A0A9X2X1E3_9GAMM|nr:MULTISPECIES: two-component system response regulator NarL [Chromohalobacter]MCK2042706.1 two-component system response regulator NarL [Chromohalobacter moromii]MCK2045393.1 two-component system response regulator NarL [Chromohalobacter moromii]MCT8504940.1 two-component system response regulator NarL [Chromohalobacter moromii]MCT8514774.1 two-component system response regulator NarL [Chromohalobacter sp. TMW 2.2271]